MKRKLICFYGLLIFTVPVLTGGESYSELMDRAEKLTSKRYDPNSRAYKIKAAELDEILDSDAGREEKIKRLKAYIGELEDRNDGPEGKKPSGIHAPKPEPLQVLKQAADRGDADALCRLGVIYWEGKQVRRSLRRSLEYFRRAAAKQNQLAQFMLAYADMTGKSVIPDEKKAFAEFRKLYDAGFAPAGLPLGILHYEGRGTPKNYVLAAECLRRGLPSKSDVPVEFHPETVLGRIYYAGGYGLKPDHSEAFRFLKQADKDFENQYLLGCLLRDGKGTAADPAAAAAYFRRSADQGNHAAGKEFGKLCHAGRGVKKDDLLAVRYLAPAADANDPEAAMLLAEIHADEKSPAHDAKYALHHYRTAARAGDPSALYCCGYMILNGIGTEKDVNAALQYLEAAAKGNHAEAAFLCGKIRQAGKHPERSVPFYRQAADLGHTEAMRVFAAMAAKGQYMKADPELGVRYLEKLAGHSDFPAVMQLAEIYEKGFGKIRPDEKKAMRYYHQAAEKGNVKAQAKLAFLYYARGDRENARKYASEAARQKHAGAILLLDKLQQPSPQTDQSAPDETERYLRELADSGDRNAMKQLGGKLYARGQWAEAEKYLNPLEKENDPEILFMLGDLAAGKTDGKPDYEHAFRLMKRAAEAGHVKAMIRQGRMYHRGEGVRQDFRLALILYRQAAGKQDPEGMFLTGCMFYNGEGVSPDYTEAYRWFRQAAEKGNVLAMQYLAIMFKEGIGVPKNNVEAVKWRRKAAGSK